MLILKTLSDRSELVYCRQQLENETRYGAMTPINQTSAALMKSRRDLTSATRSNTRDMTKSTNTFSSKRVRLLNNKLDNVMQVQHLRGFLGQLCQLENCILSTLRQMPQTITNIPRCLPQILTVLEFWCHLAHSFSRKNVSFDFERAF